MPDKCKLDKLLDDFVKWSGGFRPYECSTEEIQKYCIFGMDRTIGYTSTQAELLLVTIQN